MRELIGARELVMSLVGRDLKVRYRGTFLGLLWSFMTPVLMVGLYSFIFGVILPQPFQAGQRYPFAVHFFTGLVIWNFFGNTIGGAMTSVITSGYLLRKLYFPRSILPLSMTLSNFVTLGFEFSVLMVVVLIYRVWPNPYWLLIPACIVIVFLLAYGISLALSALLVFFRDLQHLFGIVLQLWFWGTPVIYPLTIVKGRPKLALLLLANPMTAPLTVFRNALLNRSLGIEPIWLAYSFGMGILSVIVGGAIFHRSKRLFPELV